MRATVKAFFFFIAFFFFFPSLVWAQSQQICAKKMVSSIEIESILENGSSTRKYIYPTSTFEVYRDNAGYYLDAAGKNKITNIRELKVNINKSFLDQIGSGDQGFFTEDTNIDVFQSGSCPNFYEYTDKLKSTPVIRTADYTVGGGALGFWEYQCAFETPYRVQLRQGRSGSNAVCDEVYSVTLKDRPSAGQCKLMLMKNNAPATNGITAQDNFSIKGEGIDDKRAGIRLFLDETDVSPNSFVVGDDEGRDAATGLIGFTYDSQPLSVGSYRFSVRYEDGAQVGKEICTMSIPVVAANEVPTPPQEVTPDAPVEGESVVEIAQPIPLCESIPAGADCGNGLCRTKCTACEQKNGIWTGIGCIPTNASGIVQSLFTTFAGILGALVFWCIVSNGLKIMWSRGNPEALKKGQEAITSCIVGLLVLLFSVFFLQVVGVDILKLPGFAR